MAIFQLFWSVFVIEADGNENIKEFLKYLKSGFPDWNSYWNFSRVHKEFYKGWL